MPNPRSFDDTRTTPQRAGTAAAPDPIALRDSCFSLLVDVPASDRKAMLQRLDRMRRADDMAHLRRAMFDVIERFHGEATARERLTVLDDRFG
ncbi:MAG: hypothetical protein KGL99_11985 [Burkholderiales bacterium]|nr:hypothetical protein [Burkholderiales bacterium]MDE2296737.1 hypothetical protein [Burkholderiales bacterium]MDE2627863.1 hypothetical protein [Burkholderiales bacterium]